MFILLPEAEIDRMEEDSGQRDNGWEYFRLTRDIGGNIVYNKINKKEYIQIYTIMIPHNAKIQRKYPKSIQGKWQIILMEGNEIEISLLNSKNSGKRNVSLRKKIVVLNAYIRKGERKQWTVSTFRARKLRAN